MLNVKNINVFNNARVVQTLVQKAMRGRSPIQTRKLRLVGRDMPGYAPQTEFGVQNGRCRKMLTFATAALGLETLDPGGRAVNEPDGSVSLTVEGREKAIDGLEQFLAAQKTFWVYALGGPMKKDNSNVRIESGFPPVPLGLLFPIEPMLQSWNAMLSAKRPRGAILEIAIRAPWETLELSKEKPQLEELCFTNHPGSRSIFDYLSRRTKIPVARWDGTSFTTGLFPLDKFVWIKEVENRPI